MLRLSTRLSQACRAFSSNIPLLERYQGLVADGEITRNDNQVNMIGRLENIGEDILSHVDLLSKYKDIKPRDPAIVTQMGGTEEVDGWFKPPRP